MSVPVYMRHRLTAAAAFGFLFPLVGRYVPWASLPLPWGSLAIAGLITYLFALTVLCSPLRDCRIVLGVCLVAWICYAAVSVQGMVSDFAQASARMWLAVFALHFALAGVAPAALLCAVVYFRNRYWPVYAAGQCAKCGYNLRGLSDARCPECGTSFEAPES